MRLIDADALKAKAFGKRGGLIHTADIDAAPSVDAVRLVRCRDCKFYTSISPLDNTGICRLFSMNFGGDGFCCAAERWKDGDNG